jgi:hypothetical protein
MRILCGIFFIAWYNIGCECAAHLRVKMVVKAIDDMVRGDDDMVGGG